MSIEAMRQALEALECSRQSHYYCEDTWYSCPKHDDGCANEAEGDECNCGADETNKTIDAAITALRAAIEQAEKPTLTFDELAHKLVSLNLIQEDAIDDPEGYDGGMRIQAIEVLHRFITIGEEP